MVAAGVITTEQDLIASLLSESLAELSAALSPEKVIPALATSLTLSFVKPQVAIRIFRRAVCCSLPIKVRQPLCNTFALKLGKTSLPFS
jgi:hypothetical protein